VRCKQLIDNLSGYLDGELDPELAARLAQHLEHCEDCSIVVDTTKKTIQICCSTEPAPLPQDVHERLNRLYAEKLGVRLPNTSEPD
jgi:anti-sigma factor (TIGR02949 family)